MSKNSESAGQENQTNEHSGNSVLGGERCYGEKGWVGMGMVEVGGEWASNAVMEITTGKGTSSAETEAGAWLVCSGNEIL